MNPLARQIARIRAKWAFERAMTEFDRRVFEARRRHRPIRDIEAERRAYVHGLLAGAVEGRR